MHGFANPPSEQLAPAPGLIAKAQSAVADGVFRPEGSIKGSIPAPRSTTCNSMRKKKPRERGFCRALFRTRTGDALLTMEAVAASSVMANACESVASLGGQPGSPTKLMLTLSLTP